MADVPQEVLLSGYYGFGNVGDDALCEALVGQFAGAGVQIVTIPAGDRARLPRHPAVRALARFDHRGMRASLRRGAALFCGGGGLLQNATSQRSLLYYLGLLWLARRWRRRYVLGLQSIGPLRGWLWRRLTARLARGAAAISVRDQRSKETLIGLGLRAERVVVSADAAFLLPPPSAAELAEAEISLPPGHRIAVCLRHTAHTARVLDAFGAWQPGDAVLVLLACAEPDHALHQQLAARLGPARAVALPPAGVRTTLALLAGCDQVISERLHPLIFATIGGVPAAGIDYDPKVAGLAADLGLPLAGSDADLTAVGLAGALAELQRRGEAEPARLLAHAAAAREAAAAEVQRLLATLTARS